MIDPIVKAGQIFGDRDFGWSSRGDRNVVRAGILVRELEGETLVLDTVGDRIHRLNALAAEIWRLHEAGVSPAQIAARLATQYDVGEESAHEDVTRTVDQFRILGLID